MRAQFGVPNCCAQRPVSACIWSRPVKKASFFGIGRADMREAFAQQIKRVVPRNRVVEAIAPLGAGAANHRVLQLRLRILLHDARAALGAEHALIHHVIRVAPDEAYVRLTRLAGFPGLSSVVTLMPQRQAHM